MHGTFLDVVAVYRVNNPEVEQRYNETVAQLHAPQKMHRENLFHGTPEDAMLSICQEGFDPEHASFRGWL